MSLVFWQHRTVSQDVASQAKVDTDPLAEMALMLQDGESHSSQLHWLHWAKQ